jgi:hypothetical protein
MDPPSEKRSQHSAAYQFMPNGVERCEYCSMFRPAASCTAVRGVISRTGWCQLYAPKSNPRERTASSRLR